MSGAASPGPPWSRRSGPVGGLRFRTESLPTDRLFTGPIGDLEDDRFSFFQSCSNDVTIGKFHSPDTLVPEPTRPQTLNRYADARNNPLRLNDPTGYDALDPSTMTPTGIQRYQAAYQGLIPTLRDWRDDQLSLSYPGTGPLSAWTGEDWALYGGIESQLGATITRQLWSSVEEEEQKINARGLGPRQSLAIPRLLHRQLQRQHPRPGHTFDAS